uniref:Uncharacterized protein n=1 Tax=Caulobacter sp. (strain K31) TaxID=366602 RepID=B0T427_CAUSK
MRRIVDLTEGGGARGGQDVWFRMVMDDGIVETFGLDASLYDAFVGGLRRFDDEAARLRGEAARLRNVNAVRCSALDGDLVMTLETEGGPLDVRIPAGRLKPMLHQIVVAIAPAASAPSTPSVPLAVSSGA